MTFTMKNIFGSKQYSGKSSIKATQLSFRGVLVFSSAHLVKVF